MTKPLKLEIGDKVKMVRNEYPNDFEADETPLGEVGTVVRTDGSGQPYLVYFEQWNASLDCDDHEWWCNRSELRKLPDGKLNVGDRVKVKADCVGFKSGMGPPETDHPFTVLELDVDGDICNMADFEGFRGWVASRHWVRKLHNKVESE